MFGVALATTTFTGTLAWAADGDKPATPPCQVGPCGQGQNCPGYGQGQMNGRRGQGQGMGQQHRRGQGQGMGPGPGFRGGPRDGTGPRRDGSGGQCPARGS